MGSEQLLIYGVSTYILAWLCKKEIVTMSARKFRVNLSEKDSEYLKEIAEKMNTSESEVIRKGLKLIALYAEDEENSLILKNEKSGDQTLVIL